MEPTDLRDLYRQEYVERFERIQSWRRVARLVRLMSINKSDRIVDIGCGNGMLVPFVAPLARTYLGVDFSEEFIAAANRSLVREPRDNVEFRCLRVETLAVMEPHRFDVALALDLAEHVPDGPWLDILRAVRALLTQEGRLYLHTPNAAFFLERMKARNLLVRQFPEHVAVRTRDAHERLLQAAGFKLVRSLIIPHYNVLRLLHPISHIPGLRQLFGARLFLEARA